MAGWHHWLDGCESDWTPGVGDGQGGLACWDLWGRKELDTTKRLNWTELKIQLTCLYPKSVSLSLDKMSCLLCLVGFPVFWPFVSPRLLYYRVTFLLCFPCVTEVKNPPTMQEPQETQVGSLGLEDPLEEGMAMHCSILAWRIPWTGEPGGLQSVGFQKSRTWLSNSTITLLAGDWWVC